MQDLCKRFKMFRTEYRWTVKFGVFSILADLNRERKVSNQRPVEKGIFKYAQLQGFSIYYLFCNICTAIYLLGMAKGSNNIAIYWIKDKFKNHSCGAFIRNIKRPHFRPTSIFLRNVRNSTFSIQLRFCYFSEI